MSAPAKKLGVRILHGLAAIAVGTVIASAAWHGYRAVAAMPIAHVVFAGDVDRLPQGDLEALARAVVAARSPSLSAVRDSARRVPWVREASVRRLYPDTAEITFEAHTALARWNGDRLVSRRGEVFAAPGAGELPAFRGPEDAAARMAAEFPALSAALAPLGAVKALRLTARGGWEAQLEGGLTVQLGREDWPARARRFVAAWPRLPEDARATRYADLRYANGFALRATLTPALSEGKGRNSK